MLKCNIMGLHRLAMAISSISSAVVKQGSWITKQGVRITSTCFKLELQLPYSVSNLNQYQNTIFGKRQPAWWHLTLARGCKLCVYAKKARRLCSKKLIQKLTLITIRFGIKRKPLYNIPLHFYLCHFLDCQIKIIHFKSGN